MAIFPAAVIVFNPNNSRSYIPFCKSLLPFPVISFSLHILGKLHIFPFKNIIFKCIQLLNFLSMNIHSVHFKHSFSLLALLPVKRLLSCIGYAPSKCYSGLKLPRSNYSLFKLISTYLSNNAVTSKTLEIDRQGLVILDICLLLHTPVTINSIP